MNDKGGSADIYDSPLDLANANDPRTLALRLIAPGKTVLELGPATGRVTRVLSEQGCQVVAVERDGAMAPNLEPYCSRVIVGDVERLSLEEVFGEQRFDVILAGDFLEHLAHPLKLLQDLKRYLSEDGYIVASIPNIAHGSVRLSLLAGKFEYKDIGILDRTHLRFFTLDSILRLFADAGFAIVDVQRVRQDPFREPYIDRLQPDKPELSPELKRLIEDDPDAATVQFVVKAFPVNSSTARLQVLLTLQNKIQEKEKTVFHLEKALEDQRGHLEKTVEDLRGALHQRDHTVSGLKEQIQILQNRIEGSRLQADGARRTVTELQIALTQVQTALRERERAIRELQASNEMLTVWLTKYKNAKEKLLPTGSLRDRVARNLAGSLLTKSVPASEPHSEPEPTVESGDSVPALDLDAVIDPPDEWLGDPKRPPIVIAIPNWNRAELLRPCIESVLSNTGYDRYRICVYEQGSNDGSREYLVSLGTRIDSIFSSKNVGFVAGNNAIIQRYPKWDVVFLNNDTQVTKGWLEALVETACSADNIGLVGCKLVYPSGSLQEAGSQIFQDGSARAYGKYEDQWSSQFNQLREVDYCSAACLYAKRELLDAVGGFDERYSPAYYEDSDLAFAARGEGFKVLYQPRSVVIHHEYGTSGQTAADRMESNRQKFVDKWSAALCRQRRNLWEAVSATSREKVLVIHDLLPGPDRSSGGRRLYEFVRLLARHYHVVLAYLHPYQVREYLKPLERYGITVFYPGYAKAVHNPNLDIKAILENNEFEYVFCELYTVAEQYLDLVRSCSPASKIIIDTFDVHFLREMRKAELLNDPELRERARQTEQRELDIYRRADMILTVTSADKEAVLQKDARIPVRVVPNIHSLPQRVVGRQERKDLLFVGGFSHEPNVDAMLYFCSELFPLVQAQLPDIKLHIVGNAPPVEIIALASDHIVVEGHVMNLGPYLESALVSIAPLRYGSGMKGKVGEAMAYGLPVVTTTIGAEGMNLQHGVHVLIADETKEFADSIRQLHDDPALWESLAKNGRLRVEQEWSPSAVEGSICEALDSLATVASVRSA
jgi:GT2 family glycosyltransferase/2-polyprenyl-3-methyl-5-hydroxy-6-metoxy-1,4-benzoquinol methylase